MRDAGQWSTHVTNGAIYSLPYDLLKDFEPVALLASQPYLISAKKTLPPNDLNGLIAWLKANPDKALAGTAGVGAESHIMGVFFQHETNARFQFVPYRGAFQAIQDLVAGQIDLMFNVPSNIVPQARAGTIKAYAVAVGVGQKRRYHRPLSGALFTDRHDSIFENARLEPFLDQAEDARVGDPVLYESHQPGLADFIEKGFVRTICGSK